MKRRKFMTIAGTGVVAVGGLTYFINQNYQSNRYDKQVAQVWRHTNRFNIEGKEAMMELVRYATLAANSHNTQPWLFKIGTNSIVISPDFARGCPVVDPDNHHLYASLGCATENIVHAAKAFGLKANISINERSNDIILIEFEPTTSKRTELFQAIPMRQCTKVAYDGRKASAMDINMLKTSTDEEGISTTLFTTEKDMETILEYVVEGNTAQMRDKAFIKELKDWIRFNPSSSIKAGDGLFTASSGNPTSPSWLGSMFFDLAFTEKVENDKYRDQIRSSAGVIAFISEKNDKEHWIKAGRSYQRFALQATALGLKHAFVNQPIEVPSIREQFAQYLNIGDKRADLLVRFGYGPKMPKSLRRPVNEVVIV